MSSSDINSDFRLDFRRAERIGFDEAVLSAGKSASQLSAILDRAAEQGARLLLTRLEKERFEDLPERQRACMDYDRVSRTAFFGPPTPLREEARIAVVTAGTSDVPVAREAVRTLRYYGQACLEVADVGVAGLWRLLRDKRAVIVAAGMDAALPSVVGGLVPGAVIAVPTSIGYGVAQGGRTALHAALASCAAGITVVNIDNGYGAACAALRIVNTL
jgi:NCAIR mutase (PurE)-related protein